MIRASLVAAIAVAAVRAGPLTISERTVRLQPHVSFELVVRGRSGCFEWASERPDVAVVVGQRCEGDAPNAANRTCCDGASVATVRTLELPADDDDGGDGFDAEGNAVQPHRVLTFVTARPLDGEPDAVYCEVNVAPIARLEILTTVRNMNAHELQWLGLSAFDEIGNAFSPTALEWLNVSWSFDPQGPIRPIAPAETRQQLDETLARMGATGNWPRYHRLAVLAGNKTGAAIRATAQIGGGRAGGRGGGVVVAVEMLSVLPSTLSLFPPGRAVLAPATTLQYVLLSCGVDHCARMATFGAKWSVAPEAVASVQAGTVLAIEGGPAAVQLSQPQFDGSAPFLVSPPAALRITLLEPKPLAVLPPDAPDDDAEHAAASTAVEAAGGGGTAEAEGGASRHTLLLRDAPPRLVRVEMVSRDGGGLRMVLPRASGPTDASPYHSPRFEWTDDGVVALKVLCTVRSSTHPPCMHARTCIRLTCACATAWSPPKAVPAWKCGEGCTLEACAPTATVATCARHRQPTPLCLCYEMATRLPGNATLSATLQVTLTLTLHPSPNPSP